MYKIVRPQNYQKKERKFLKKHPELISQYTKTLKVLSLNPKPPSLRLHEIKQKGCHSVSINMQYRILLTLKMLDNGDIVLISLGDHDVYRH